MTEQDWILVVDDEAMNRQLVRRVLGRHYEIADAGDVEEALNLLASRDVTHLRLVLCDQLMPGRSGTELAVELSKRGLKVPFVLVTGYDGDSRVNEAVDGGSVTEVFVKPWRPMELSQLVKRLLSSD